MTTIDPAHIKAIYDLAAEIAVTMEAIGINGRGYDVALNVLAVMADKGWQLDPPPHSIWETTS